MALDVCVLASGSAGNCIYVAGGGTAILIDAGLSARETARRLEQVGVDVRGISAVCLTHEHCDHTAGLSVLHRRLGIPVYANTGTIQGLERDGERMQLAWNVFTTGSPFRVGELVLEPFSVPHDAYDPVGFVVVSGVTRVGIVTDMGTATNLVRERLRTCHAVVIESNHDRRLLQEADRPWALKQRILGRQGHLSNDDAAAMLVDIAGTTLRHVFLAHLSSKCNRPELAMRAVTEALEKRGGAHITVAMCYADRISDMWSGA